LANQTSSQQNIWKPNTTQRSNEKSKPLIFPHLIRNQTKIKPKYFRNPIFSFQNQTRELPLRNSWTGLEPPNLMDWLEPPDLREQVLLHEESASRELGSSRSAPLVTGGAQSA
jgi:hypothetical protein